MVRFPATGLMIPDTVTCYIVVPLVRTKRSVVSFSVTSAFITDLDISSFARASVLVSDVVGATNWSVRVAVIVSFHDGNQSYKCC